MFSFFRKKTASKDSKPEQQPPVVKAEEEDKKIAESNKKRTKKTSKDKKGSFKSETEPTIVSSDTSSTSSIASHKAAENVPPIALITEEQSPLTPPLVGTVDHVEVVELPLPSDSSILLQEEPPDEFCEAHEVILPELPIPVLPITLTQPSPLAPTDGPESETTRRLAKDLPEKSTKDKQPRRVSFNCKDIVISDPGDVSLTDSAIPDATHVLPITITQRDLDEAAQSPFLSEEASPLHEISIVQQDDTMSTLEEDQTDMINAMKEQIRRLESELREKTERVEQLEAILADEERQVQLEVIERLEAEWNKERELVDNEREEELRLLQEALEEALEEKAEIESKMLRDASRESQLLDDFEWKLGEIEREYKKKLVETEKSAEERFKNEMAMEYQKLVEDKRDIDEKLTEIAHLKSYEAEVIQLRGLVFEQQRVIRTAARQVDHLKETEKILEDDLHRIRMQGCTRKQQQEMEAKWKENSLIEYNRLRAELVASNEEEMLKAIRQVVREKDDQIAAIKKQLDTQQVAMNHQIAELKNSFQQREAKLNKQVEETRAEADRELCELRRQLNKVQDSHIEFMEQVEQKHAEELEQRGSSSEESKEALEQTYEEKLQSIEIQHQSQLNALQSLIEEEKQEALTQLGEHYQTQLQSLQEHISDLQRRLTDANKMSSQRQQELDRLQELVLRQEEQLELLQRSEDRTESNRETSSSRRRGSDDESTASTTESSGEEDYDESTPPNGRSAGDGCSPSTSAATSQDNLRPCPDLDAGILSSTRSAVATHHVNSSEECLSIKIEQFEQMQSTIMCCDDPEHAEAQQIILEMHQVLADRDAELQRLTEEKRFYQLELIHWERNLALQRVGLPLALVPDRLSNESELNPWRGFSAPPVTKPRLPDHLRYPSATAFAGSRAASYELFSPSATSLSPDCGRQLFAAQHSSALMTTDEWMSEGGLVPPDERQMHWPAQQGSHFYYSDDDDDSNNNGFTTPL
ncbi:tax1-binding protein 1 homolog isoform X2 [Daphnia carinata]|uniref:tax1-binding protein 1 homolog isoform X2 n=1 Tax=Daphnia carinata TaxID=120202 RepID=UPI002579D9F5|nr:tax1-binding protein 1 homolog isoform X2 [Daphnia carinata]